jgi:ABC-type transport system involved in multi-copper enzyme maturation permease subunit
MLRLASPLFYFEMLRQTRKGRGHTLRVTYAIFVLLGIALIYSQYFDFSALLDFSFAQYTGMNQKELSDFADSLTRAFLLMQALAVTLLTPACVAGAVAEEKERQSLELLFTTHLTEWDILTSKLYGRLAPVTEMLLAGVPILALLQILGGLPFSITAAVFAATVAALLCYGCMSLFASTMGRTVQGAVGISYGLMSILLMVLLFLSLCFSIGFRSHAIASVWLLSPATLLLSLERVYQSQGEFGLTCLFFLTTFIATQLIFAIIFFLASWRQLRWERGAERYFSRVAPPRQEERWRPRPVTVVEEYAEPPPVQQPVLSQVPEEEAAGIPKVLLAEEPPPRRPYRTRRRLSRRLRHALLPPETGDPLIWKEVTWGRLRPETEQASNILFGVAGGFLLLIVLLCAGVNSRGYNSSEWYPDMAATVLSILGIPITLIFCLLTGYRTAGCILKEKMLKTWDSLLTLPRGRYSVLKAKLQGSLWAMKPLAWKVLAVWSVATIIVAIPWYASPLLLLHIASVAFFLGMVGLWLSLRCKTLLQAQVRLGIWIVIMFVVLWPFGFSPLQTWWFLIFHAHRRDSEEFLLRMTGVFVTSIVWLVFAGLLWLACVRHAEADVEG